MRTLRKRRFAAVTATTAAVLLGAGIAVAYWTTEGSGSDQATVGTTEDLTYSLDTAVEDLFPGDAQDIDIAVNNPGPPVHVDTISITIDGVTGADGTCDVSPNFEVDDAVVDAVVPSGASTLTAASEIRMVETGVDQNGCKNATIALSFSS